MLYDASYGTEEQQKRKPLQPEGEPAPTAAPTIPSVGAAALPTLTPTQTAGSAEQTTAPQPAAMPAGFAPPPVPTTGVVQAPSVNTTMAQPSLAGYTGEAFDPQTGRTTTLTPEQLAANFSMVNGTPSLNFGSSLQGSIRPDDGSFQWNDAEQRYMAGDELAGRQNAAILASMTPEQQQAWTYQQWVNAAPSADDEQTEHLRNWLAANGGASAGATDAIAAGGGLRTTTGTGGYSTVGAAPAAPGMMPPSAAPSAPGSQGMQGLQTAQAAGAMPNAYGQGSTGPMAGVGTRASDPATDLRGQVIGNDPSQRLNTLKGYTDRAIGGVMDGPSRAEIARQRLEAFDTEAQPMVDKRIKQVGKRAASLGRLGMGQTSIEALEPFTDYLTSRKAMETRLAADTAEGEIGDRFGRLTAARGLESGVAGEERGLRDEQRGERTWQEELARYAQEQAIRQRVLEGQEQSAQFGRGIQLANLGYSGNPAQTLLSGSNHAAPSGNEFDLLMDWLIRQQGGA
jgi:hypothetical protein